MGHVLMQIKIKSFSEIIKMIPVQMESTKANFVLIYCNLIQFNFSNQL